jgi:hypothetical protein
MWASKLFLFLAAGNGAVFVAAAVLDPRAWQMVGSGLSAVAFGLMAVVGRPTALGIKTGSAPVDNTP